VRGRQNLHSHRPLCSGAARVSAVPVKLKRVDARDRRLHALQLRASTASAGFLRATGTAERSSPGAPPMSDISMDLTPCPLSAGRRPFALCSVAERGKKAKEERGQQSRPLSSLAEPPSHQRSVVSTTFNCAVRVGHSLWSRWPPPFPSRGRQAHGSSRKPLAGGGRFLQDLNPQLRNWWTQ
jgi:hypothetical protein